MRQITKLRLTNAGVMFMSMFTMGSLIASLMNFTLRLTDKNTGQVTTVTVAARTWYEDHLFGLSPQLGMIIGLLSMVGLTSLYVYLHARTHPQEIESGNEAVEAWIQRNWWKVLLLLIVLSLLTAEVVTRWFPA